MIDTYLLVALSFSVGAVLLYWRKKRKFDRLNEHGIEAYTSYAEKVKTNATDTILLWVGCASIIGGTIILMLTNYSALGWVLFTIFTVFLITKWRR